MIHKSTLFIITYVNFCLKRSSPNLTNLHQRQLHMASYILNLNLNIDFISDTIYSGVASEQQDSLSDTRISSYSPVLIERHFSGRPLPTIPSDEQPFSYPSLHNPVSSPSHSSLPPSSLVHSKHAPSASPSFSSSPPSIPPPLPPFHPSLPPPLPPFHPSLTPPLPPSHPSLPPSSLPTSLLPASHPPPPPPPSSISLADALKKKSHASTKPPPSSSSGKPS